MQVHRERNYEVERNLRAFGLLNYFFSFMFLLSALTLSPLPKRLDGDNPYLLFVIMVLWALGPVCYFIGRGLRTLNPRVRKPAMILSTFGLLGFPIGTALSGYLLKTLLSESGKFVLSDGYQEILRETNAPTIDTDDRTKLWAFVFILISLVNVAMLL